MRKPFLALLSGALVVVLSVGAGAPVAGGASTAAKEPTVRPSDNRTSPLAGLWTHQKGGFYHDGRFATLLDVVEHYNGFLKLGLGEGEKHALVEYLKSL